MSRHILIPASETRKSLLVEVSTNEVKTISLPAGIFEPDMFKRVHDTRKLRNLLLKISMSKISRSKEGTICHDGEKFDVSHDDAVVDSCNSIFKEKYEPLYCLFAKNNIFL